MSRDSMYNSGYMHGNMVEHHLTTSQISEEDINRFIMEQLSIIEQSYHTGMITPMSNQIYETPNNIKALALQDLNTIPLTTDIFSSTASSSTSITLQNLKKAQAICIEECKNVLLIDQNILRWYPHTFYKAQEEHPDWSMQRLVAYSVYEFAKSQFANKISGVLLKICVRHFGQAFGHFLCSAFMSESITLLIEYLVDRLFPTLFPRNGAGKGSDKNIDELNWLIELIIFILKYLFAFFISWYFRTPLFLTQFLVRIVPHFLKWIIEMTKK